MIWKFLCSITKIRIVKIAIDADLTRAPINVGLQRFLDNSLLDNTPALSGSISYSPSILAHQLIVTPLSQHNFSSILATSPLQRVTANNYFKHSWLNQLANLSTLLIAVVVNFCWLALADLWRAQYQVMPFLKEQIPCFPDYAELLIKKFTISAWLSCTQTNTNFSQTWFYC